MNAKDPDYSAKLAKINSEINIYSQNRQAAMSFLKDGLTGMEENLQMAQGWIQTRGRLITALSR